LKSFTIQLKPGNGRFVDVPRLGRLEAGADPVVVKMGAAQASQFMKSSMFEIKTVELAKSAKSSKKAETKVEKHG